MYEVFHLRFIFLLCLRNKIHDGGAYRRNFLAAADLHGAS
jgi:hypothetical protein